MDREKVTDWELEEWRHVKRFTKREERSIEGDSYQRSIYKGNPAHFLRLTQIFPCMTKCEAGRQQFLERLSRQTPFWAGKPGKQPPSLAVLLSWHENAEHLATIIMLLVTPAIPSGLGISRWRMPAEEQTLLSTGSPFSLPSPIGLSLIN